jgi:hypothetical protein
MTQTLTLVEKWEVDALRQRAEKCNELYQAAQLLQKRVNDLETELRNARLGFGLAVLSVGGTLRVPYELVVETGDIEISRREDVTNCETIYTAKAIPLNP